MKVPLEVFTIGHSNLEFEVFVKLLRQYGIKAVADVRSTPYSQFTSQFNRDILHHSLRKHGVAYVFLGTELGARRSERECYIEGRADYSLIAQTEAFKQGIDRVVTGARRLSLALMCAEKDPIDCHRCILVSPHLRQRGLLVRHILQDGTVEEHEHCEKRLLRSFDLADSELFLSPEQILAEAYSKQAIRIAYQEDAPVLREEPPTYGN
jgi:uncharacterized protein (DUF488 family)